MGFGAGDFRGGFFAGALEAELEVIEAGFDEFAEARFVERQAGGDEVDVEAGGASGADEIEDVGAGERFAAGEVGLQDAELRRLRGRRATRFRWTSSLARAVSSSGLEQ